ESLEVLDSRFHGNDGMLWESRPLGGGNIQRLSESLEVLDSRFTGMTKGCGNPACSVSVFFEVSGNF
ncbi:hypothetical protein, partial [Neisseria meningitidis]|uniref:hypothetical protein n=1 Tax=Neisseria meningitidis TaxID=487 RepID=UPI001C84E8B0